MIQPEKEGYSWEYSLTVNNLLGWKSGGGVLPCQTPTSTSAASQPPTSTLPEKPLRNFTTSTGPQTNKNVMSNNPNHFVFSESMEMVEACYPDSQGV